MDVESSESEYSLGSEFEFALRKEFYNVIFNSFAFKNCFSTILTFKINNSDLFELKIDKLTVNLCNFKGKMKFKIIEKIKKMSEYFIKEGKKSINYIHLHKSNIADISKNLGFMNYLEDFYKEKVLIKPIRLYYNNKISEKFNNSTGIVILVVNYGLPIKYTLEFNHGSKILYDLDSNTFNFLTVFSQQFKSLEGNESTILILYEVNFLKDKFLKATNNYILTKKGGKRIKNEESVFFQRRNFRSDFLKIYTQEHKKEFLEFLKLISQKCYQNFFAFVEKFCYFISISPQEGDPLDPENLLGFDYIFYRLLKDSLREPELFYFYEDLPWYYGKISPKREELPIYVEKVGECLFLNKRTDLVYLNIPIFRHLTVKISINKRRLIQSYFKLNPNLVTLNRHAFLGIVFRNIKETFVKASEVEKK